MAQVLLNAQILLASTTGTTALDLGPFTGQWDWGCDVEMKEAPSYANLGYRGIAPGLLSGLIDTSGSADYAAGGISTILNTSHAREQFTEGIIIGGVNAVAGDPCLFTRGLLGTWKSPIGKTGDLAGYKMALGVDNAPVDGQLAATLANRSASLTGTAVQLGAVVAPRRLWVALYVIAAAGTNLAVTIQSDNASGFPSPATALTFATVSATGGQFLSAPAPITDDWFRVSDTKGSGNFTYCVVFGVA